MSWKVEQRKDCKECGGPITSKRFRTYCSNKCRERSHNKKYYRLYDRNEGQRQRAGAKAKGKIQCLECGGWYWKVGAHVTQRHGMTAREYKELHRLEVSKGIEPEFLKKEWAQNALDNGMDKQLEKAGKPTRFKPGQHGVGKYERSPITLEKLKQHANQIRPKKKL